MSMIDNKSILEKADLALADLTTGGGILEPAQAQKFMRLLVKQLNDNLVDRKIQLNLASEVVDWIIEQTCKDRSYGARPLRRAIQRYVEDPLSEELIRGHLRDGEGEVYLEGGLIAYRPAGELTGGRQLVV